MLRKYAAKKDFGFALLFLLCPLISWLLPLIHPNIFIVLFALIVTLFFLWIWIGTYYVLDEEYFISYSGPFRKKIPIKKIVKIDRNVQAFSGRRPALAFRYLQVRYNTYDDVFIAPENEDALIADLIRIRPEINIS